MITSAFAIVVLQILATTTIVSGASVMHTSILEYGDIKYLVSKNVVGTINIDSTSITRRSNSSSSLNIQTHENPEIASLVPSRHKGQHSVWEMAIPITIIALDLNTVSNNNISSEWLKATITSMLSADDVFGPFFLETVLFGVFGKIQQSPTIFEDGVKVLGSLGVKDHSILRVDDSIPSGPYFLQSGSIYQAMRLYPDPYGAFMYGVMQSEDGFARPHTELIPVPSRLYTNSSLPLSSKRIAVKDIIDLRNLPTSASSKAYAQYHGSSKSTAEAIQHLISLGAVIIGKTKTTQFANGETARDWIDFQCPFNPRADGYLDPAGSSTGSAVAVAGYDWVDFAVGTDSCGSIIWPAALQGVFGLRPTLGVSELEGVMPYSSVMDTMGFFARDIQNFQLLQEVWYDKKGQRRQKPSRIIVPSGVLDSLPSDKQSVMAKFIEDAKISTGIPLAEIDINELWKSSGLAPRDISYTEYLHSTVAHIQIHESYINENTFYNKYKQKFGRYPYINPMVMHKWEIQRQNISMGDYQEALQRMAVFKGFLRSHVFNGGAVMMLPAGSGEATYRDELIAPESIDVYLQSFGFDNTFYSILGGLPSVVVPVGQRPITSKVTKETVWEPISMMIVGQAGTEAQIIDFVRKVLTKSGRPMGVLVGEKAF
ncbi:hypothetical protein AOL_s00083g464 [Orbilia oligospora ATCC 24927]|uniref:Uncharacterized protein n=1 Tax=Arthrobotrys oligospora (strain ATCC 24927 / CBS 115.81 / DSM 1491) TaxID=756982 RepID=G1XHI3_ARTOA|nr:hypothetical protein AOL_s00083g464 [Orbilia oligospora ATCC 24927]EGX47371.1 hypothetical protein AOL_s00083g464 [Orbilia oligospora ATCC 24927]